MRSPNVAASGSNRMSPIVGHHNNSVHAASRTSPIMGSSASRTSPLMSGQGTVRKSPITSSSNRMSPGVYGGTQTPSSRPSSRQSPVQPNRQSPIVSRHSPMDSVAKSPLTSVQSPSVRANHISTDLSKRSSLSENNIPHALSQKPIDAARSLNSLGTYHPRPLLSENYDTLSDDER